MENKIDLILTLIVILICLFFIDITFGITLLCIWLTAMILTCSLPLLFKNRIHIHTHFSNQILEKGDTLSITFKLTNTTCLPTPLIQLELLCPDNLQLDCSSHLALSLAPYEIRLITIRYTTLARGVTTIGLNQLQLLNPLGLKSRPLLIDFTPFQSIITIVPELYPIHPSHPLILNHTGTNDGEDDLEIPHLTYHSFGEINFECRPYLAGDSLQKIHWKQSAKKNQLMVKKDLAASLGRKYLILDPLSHYALEDSLLEAFLSLGYTLYQRGIQTTLCLFENDAWHLYKLENESTLYNLQYQLASYHFITSNIPLTDRLTPLILKSNIGENGQLLIFSPVTQDIFQDTKNFFALHQRELLHISNKL